MVLLLVIVATPLQVEEIWAQAAGSGSTQWTIETIQSSVSGLNSLTLFAVPDGSSVSPSVAFTQNGTFLRFSPRRSGSWTTESLLTGVSFSALQDLSLISSSTGVMYLGFYFDISTDSNFPSLGSITRNRFSGSWPSSSSVIAGGKTYQAGLHEVFSFDQNNSAPCVAYRRITADASSADRLYFTCYSTGLGDWVNPAPTAISTGAIASHIAFGMGPRSSIAHFAYTQATGGTYYLRYLNRSSAGTFGIVASTEIGPTATVPDNFYKDLFVDSDGRAHIFYYDPNGGDLKYAAQEEVTDTSLTIRSVIDNGGTADVGQFVSAALCPNGSAHLAYYDASNRVLKYARCISPTCNGETGWQVSFVDPVTPAPATINRGQYAQITCDSNNIVHIAYYDDDPVTSFAKAVKYATPRICGNSLIETGETCDDNDANDNNNCTNSCQTARCGDRILWNQGTGTETCEDGNNTSGDGCSSTCSSEIPSPVCGNNILEVNEGCDDGNRTTETCVYGQLSCTICSANCQNAAGAISLCGDGVLNAAAGETCDDGNTINGDRCSSSCLVEPPTCGDTTCDPAEACANCSADCGACPTICGNNVLEAGEECDDGNIRSGDGCTERCANERPAICGNNLKEEGEACDDGNLNSGDGCSASCQIEMPPPLPITPPSPISPDPNVGATTGDASTGNVTPDQSRRGILKAKGGCALEK